jgi:hypothetical protein
MSVSIDYAFVVAVDRNVLNLAQVTESAFRGAVRTRTPPSPTRSTASAGARFSTTVSAS